MKSNYHKLADSARVWIYQSNRELNSEEVSSIKSQAMEFLAQWSAHGAKLEAAFEIFYECFLVFFVDEDQAKATGCSIDKSVRLIKSLEKEFAVSLLDRNLVAYRVGDSIAVCDREEFISKMRSGEIGDNTIVFNNLVSTKKEFESGWEIPLKRSWHKNLI